MNDSIEVIRKERIAYIDALRGFTILLVVFGHINTFSFGYGGYNSNIASFFLAFRMPMFFFISGFVAYKEYAIWDKKYFLSQLRKKCRIQLVPLFVFFCAYNLLFSCRIPHFWKYGFGEYWFTLVLFEMLLIYFLVQVASNFIKRDLFFILLLLSGFGVFALSALPRDIPGYDFLCLENLFKYFQFFTIGLYCRKYKAHYDNILSNEVFKVIVFSIFILSYILLCNPLLIQSEFVLKLLRSIVIRYAGVFSILIIFTSSSKYFSSEKLIPRQMRYVGKRTLDVYLIHYFMLPNLKMLYPFFDGNSNMFLQMVISFAISILIVLCCIIVSNCIRSSNFLAYWLFGQAKNATAKIKQYD